MILCQSKFHASRYLVVGPSDYGVSSFQHIRVLNMLRKKKKQLYNPFYCVITDLRCHLARFFVWTRFLNTWWLACYLVVIQDINNSYKHLYMHILKTTFICSRFISLSNITQPKHSNSREMIKCFLHHCRQTSTKLIWERETLIRGNNQPKWTQTKRSKCFGLLKWLVGL